MAGRVGIVSVISVEHGIIQKWIGVFFRLRSFTTGAKVKFGALEDSIDALRKSYNKAATSRMQQGGEIKREMLNIDLNNQLEKIGNHALNIIETAHGDLIDDDARL